jgi:hypothetical protein
MTPPAAAAAAAERSAARRAAAAHPVRSRPRPGTRGGTPRVGPSAPRRVSGPSGGRRAARAAVAAPMPVALRLAAGVHAVAEHRLLDRLIRGRAWIAIVGVGLMGIVFMQVSMLRMNAGIGSAVEQATTLERQNAALQASVSQLSSGDRIATVAGKLGFVLPPGGSVRFLDARGVSFRKAVARIAPPGSNPPEVLAPTTALPLQIQQTGVAPDATATATGDQSASTPAAGTTTGTTATGTTTSTTAPPATTTPSTQQTSPAPTQAAATPTQQPTAAPAATGGTTTGPGR